MLTSNFAKVMAIAGLTLGPTLGIAQQPTAAELHRDRGLAAAARFPGYTSLCDLGARMRNVNLPRTASERRLASSNTTRSGQGRASSRSLQIPPTQVFDNLWFLGTSSVTSWLYGTDEGYILIDGLNTDEEAQTIILDGMAELGLDPGKVTAVLVAHAHGDHYGGADYLAETLGVDVLMTQADWDLAATLGTHPRFGPPPQMGGVVTDGQVLRFGESELTIHVTPGHTPGTVSPIFELSDGNTSHAAMLWGGTGFNFGPDVETFRQYAQSARDMAEVARQAGVDVFLSGHPRRDGGLEKLTALAERHPGGRHPFVLGKEGRDLFTVLEECALAQAARFENAKADK